MAGYELEFVKDDRTLGSKISAAISNSVKGISLKVVDLYNLKRSPYGGVLYKVGIYFDYNELEGWLNSGKAYVYDLNNNQVAYVTYGGGLGEDGHHWATLYMNGVKIDSTGVVESNVNEFVHKSPLNPTMWFKKLKKVYGYFKAGWTFDNYNIYDSDGELIYKREWQSKSFETDFDPGTKNFFRILMNEISFYQRPHFMCSKR